MASDPRFNPNSVESEPVVDDAVNVLLVDDQPNNLLALESLLSDMGLNLVTADSGRAALRHLLDLDFALILLDVQMPDLDGLETAELIRERDRSRHTPIIFLTALSRNEANVFRGYELGAVDYIFKPFHPDILRSKVSVFVELHRNSIVLRRQAEELKRLSQQNALILNAAAEGVFGIDNHGVSTFANPAAARMLDRGVAELTGMDLHGLLHPPFPDVSTCEPENCPLYAVVNGAFSHEEVETTFYQSDGRSFPVEFCASPIEDGSGNVVGSVILFRDVSEKRAAAVAMEVERRFREAEAQNRAKDNFLATLSHELRTPMTSILGWVQFLRTGGYSSEELEEALETIEASARLQARLIDEMLDVSRIILGKFQVDLTPTRIADVVEAALTTARPAATARDVRITQRVDDRDAIVEADPNRLQQVIGNVLSNAIKFTAPEKRVELAVERDDERVRIVVTDEGSGIDPKFLPFVFDRLRQAEGPASHGGLGLGLAIAQHIVEVHHGQIEAYSDGVGKGARFVVTLPLLVGADSHVAMDFASTGGGGIHDAR